MDAKADRTQAQGEVVRQVVIAHQRLQVRLNRALRPLRLTLAHISVLTHLSRMSRECTITEIANAMQAGQPGITKTIQALAALGAVDVRIDDLDGRRRSVSLAGHGQKLLDKARAAMAPVLAEEFHALSDRELRTLADLLASSGAA